jgi:hypothetical protein
MTYLVNDQRCASRHGVGATRRWFTAAMLAVCASITIQQTSGAQPACRAVMRSLSTVGPRQHAEIVTAPGRSDRDVIADAASCGVRPEPLPTILAGNIGGVPLHIALQQSVVRGAFLGGIGDPRDDGPAWSGRGANYYARTGVSVDIGRFHAMVGPQFWYAQNRTYEVMPSADATRDSFASPWYAPPNSIDLPSRFGVRPVRQIDLGESAAWGTVGPIDAGVAVTTQRWGPGERGNLLIGADAPGIPRVFVRTSQPLRTPAGAFAATVFFGSLTESRYFDDTTSNDRRSMSAWNVAWSPSDSSAFILGIAHAAQRAGSWFGGHDSLERVHGPAQQINELYAQYRDPRSGIRAWAEVGRAGALPTISRFFEIPYQGLVYLVGADRSVATRHGTVLVSFEGSNLEQPIDVRKGVRQDFYTSANIPQGWSQRGQPLGYSAGPGSNSQWLSVDWITTRGSLGTFVDRVRWNEDALFRQYLAYPNRHDVTIRGGIRGGIVWRGQELVLEGSLGHRLNYLFQNGTFIPGYRTVDLSVPALRFMIRPALSIR